MKKNLDLRNFHPSLYRGSTVLSNTTTSSREPQVNDQITQLHESLECLMAIYLSTVFSTFDVDKSGKIRLNHWKERHKIIKLPKLQNFTDAYMLGAKTCPHHTTNVFKFSHLCGAISLLNQNVSRGNDGFSLTGLRKKLNTGRKNGFAQICLLQVCCKYINIEE